MAKDLIGIEELKTFFNAHDKAAINPKRIKDMYYEEEDKIVLIDNQICDFYSGYGVWFSNQSAGNAFVLTPGQTYDVIWDGVLYAGLLCTQDGGNSLLGAAYFGDDTGIPFMISHHETKDYSDIVTEEGPTHTISVMQWGSVVHHLDPKYIKDMYYEAGSDIVLIDNQTIEFANGRGKHYIDIVNAEAGQIFTVIWDGVTYENLTCYLDGSYPTIGSNYDEIQSGTGEYPFSICPLFNEASLKSSTSESTHTITLKMKGTVVHKLDEKYIPDTIARLSDVEAMITGAIGGSY